MNKPTTSAADIIIPDPNSTAAIFQRLRDLRDACDDANSHDQILVLISAVIDEGFDTRPRVIGALHKLGYDRARVAKLLDAERHTRWRLNADKRYESIV